MESGVPDFSDWFRRSPLDSLTDEKSLTTSAPQSQRCESRRSGFVLAETNLLRVHYHLLLRGIIRGSDWLRGILLLPRRKTLSPVEKWGLIPPEPDVPPVLISLAPASSQICFVGEFVLAPFDVGTQWLPTKRKLVTLSIKFKYYLLHAVAPDYRIKSLRDYSYSRSSCPLRGLQLFRIVPSPRVIMSKLDDSVLDRDLSIPP